MTPERLAEIRAIANTDYSVAHEHVLVDTFVGTARLIDALREILGAFDGLRIPIGTFYSPELDVTRKAEEPTP